MENNRNGLSKEELNRDQIIRKDKRGCFIESLSDAFAIGKAHLQFATYDMNRPDGNRQTNFVGIYINIAEFLQLANEALTGSLHARMMSYKKSGNSDALYQTMGGTPAHKLKTARADGMGLSRVAKLTCASKYDYFFTADSGPGQENDKGLIVPKFGKNPENHVSIGLDWRELNEVLLLTQLHFNAWLSAQYRQRTETR